MDNHCSFHNINYTPKQTKSPPNFSAKNTSFQISADNILNFYSNHFSLSIIQTKKKPNSNNLKLYIYHLTNQSYISSLGGKKDIWEKKKNLENLRNFTVILAYFQYFPLMIYT